MKLTKSKSKSKIRYNSTTAPQQNGKNCSHGKMGNKARKEKKGKKAGKKKSGKKKERGKIEKTL